MRILDCTIFRLADLISALLRLPPYSGASRGAWAVLCGARRPWRPMTCVRSSPASAGRISAPRATGRSWA